MARSLNKVFLIGYTADEPMIRSFDNGKLATVTVVTNENVRRDDAPGGYIEVAEWNRVVFRNNQANIVETYVHKGSRLFIEGKLRTRSYTDKSGVKRWSTEIVSDNMIMLDSKNGPMPPESFDAFENSNSFNTRTNGPYNNNRSNFGGYGNKGDYQGGYNNQGNYGNQGGYQGGYQGGGYQGNQGGFGAQNNQGGFGGQGGGYSQSHTSYGPAGSFNGASNFNGNNSWNNKPQEPGFTPNAAAPAAPASPAYPSFDNNPYGAMSSAPAPAAAADAPSPAENVPYGAASASPFDDNNLGATTPAASAEAPAPAPTAAPVTDNSNDDDIPF